MVAGDARTVEIPVDNLQHLFKNRVAASQYVTQDVTPLFPARECRFSEGFGS